MKATGEVMAIDRSFEAAFLKSIRSLEIGLYGLLLPELQDLSDEALRERMFYADDERIFIIAEAFIRGFTIDAVWEITRIDKYFLKKLKNIIDFALELKNKTLDAENLTAAKKMGFSDSEIANLKGIREEDVRRMRRERE